MGNSAWGNGYHQGSAEGFRSGFGQGSAVGAALTLTVTGLVGAGIWTYNKIKQRRIAKHGQQLLSEGDPSEGEEAGDSDGDLSSPMAE